MKTMRKSMFISTVLMVVLLIVALSTATFAWFSANNTVIATQTTMTAATSTDANITIGWTTDPEQMGSSISFDSASALHPTIPMLKPVKAGETGTIPAQYVSTNKALSEEDTYYFTYENHNVPFLTVVDAKTAARGGTIPYSEDLAEDYGLTGDITMLKRIYRTSWEIPARYVATTSQVPHDETYQIPYNGEEEDPVPYLNVVANGTAINDNDIEFDEVNANYELYTLEDIGMSTQISATIGDRIYHMKEVEESFALIDINGAAPANFISGGMDGSPGDPGDIDFLTIFDSGGTSGTFPVQVGSNYYIDFEDCDAFVDVSAVGDRIYCVRPAATPTRTTLDDFASFDNFYTANIDVNNRFRTAGGPAPGEENLFVNLQEKGGTRKTFYLMNNNAFGSQRADVTMSVDINAESGTALSDLRIAVFVRAAGETAPYYYGTLSSGGGANTYYGAIAEGAFSTSTAFQDYSFSTDGPTLAQKISIDPQTNAAISIVVWFDGVSLGNAEAGQEVNFTFTFTAE
ncbi:MAG TPA: hypothetical protein GXZ92_06015 [Clostridiales bacterium]|nr:hypothetical protein [Clostridiales bacterium]